MNKRRALLLSTIAIISLVVITVGVTVAFFNYSKQGSTENVIKSGGITFYYDEVDKNGNGINLVDALPMTDSEGKSQTNGFNFKVEGVGTENISIPYEITLRKKLGSDDIDNIVKVYLAKTSASNAQVNTEEEVITSLYSSLEDTTHNGYSEKVLYNGLVPATASSYTQNYRLKLWIDNDTDYSPVLNQETGEDEYPYENKTFTVLVNVYAGGRVITEESKSANISSVGVNNTVLTSTEVNGIDTYETKLPAGTTSATINVETENPYSQVTVIKTESDYETPVALGSTEKVAVNKNVSVTEGNNYFKIITTSEDNKVTKETHMMIKVNKLVNLRGLAKNIYDDAITIQGSIYDNPTLTASSNNTSDLSGLYALDVEDGYANSVDGTTYYFRGNVENNYVDFAGKTWRIVRINEDGTTRLILDDYIGSSQYNNRNDRGDMYYFNSKVRSTLSTWYENNIASGDTFATKVATGNYFCEAAKVSYGSYSMLNATTVEAGYYTPDYKCITDGNSKGLINANVGLITYDEVAMAGGRSYSTNTTYYLYKNYFWWTMSPAGIERNSGRVWAIYDPGYLSPHYTFNEGSWDSAALRPVINLKADVIATGTGTSTDPYIVQ